MSAPLYKRANVKDEPDLLAMAVRRTLWPAAAALVLFWAFGGLIEVHGARCYDRGQWLFADDAPAALTKGQRWIAAVGSWPVSASG